MGVLVEFVLVAGVLAAHGLLAAAVVIGGTALLDHFGVLDLGGRDS